MPKSALVVGATGGIGKAIALLLKEKGMRVWGTYYKDEAEARELSTALGTKVEPLDVTSETSVQSGITKVHSQCENIDVLVYSVSPAVLYAPFFRSNWENYQKHIDAQVKGFYHIAKSLEAQIQKGNKVKFIVILTEYCFGKPASGISDYITGKYGLMGLAKSLSIEFSRYGSTVNMVSPGMTETELISSLPPKAVELAAAGNPLKRIAKPEDVANVVAFLASDASDYLNGINLLVNGGGVIA